jgi:hypothetical protein
MLVTSSIHTETNTNWNFSFLHEATPPPLICGLGGASPYMELRRFWCPGFREDLAPLPN